MIVHFVISRSILAHPQYFSNLSSWGCKDVSLFAIITRPSAYVAIFIVILDVPSVYLFLSLCNQRRSHSKNIMNRYGLGMSPWIVLLCIGIFCV